MKFTCVYCCLIFLVDSASIFVQATENSSTIKPPFDNYQHDYSTVLPKPMDSTKPTVLQSKSFQKPIISDVTTNLSDLSNAINQRSDQNSESNKKISVNLVSLNNRSDKEIVIHNEKESIRTVNESIPINRSSDQLDRSRISKRLASTYGMRSKNNRIPVELNRNQSVASADLHTNMSVIRGRSSMVDEQPEHKSFLDDKYLEQHMSAYDRVKIKNDKFQYDNFFQLYDHVPDNLLDEPEDEDNAGKSQPSRNEPSNYSPYLYRPTNSIVSMANVHYPAQYSQQQQQPQQPQSPSYYASQQQQPQSPSFYTSQQPQTNAMPYEYAFVPPSQSTVNKFKKYQKQRIRELLHRPVSQMFAGKFKPDYEPKYMLEAPQRSHQQTGLGELFTVLGPLVILPLLSSFALSTFTTLYVTKSLIAKPAASTTLARHKQFNGKLLKEDSLVNQTMFGLGNSGDQLIFHPFNASDYDLKFLKIRNNQRLKKSSSLDDEKQKLGNQQSFNEHKDESTHKRQEGDLKYLNNTNSFQSLDALQSDSFKNLKRSKRSLRHDLVRKELGLHENPKQLMDRNRFRRRLRRSSRWNEVLWTRSKQVQTLWLPLAKRLARQPRNSLHNKLYIVRPTKKPYNKALNGDMSHVNLTTTNTSENHNLMRFVINDAIENAKQIITTKFQSKFDTTDSDSTVQHSAASSPTPTYVNFSTTMIPGGFTNFNSRSDDNPTYQPKMYNLKINSPVQIDQQLIKRNSANNFVISNKPLKPFQAIGSNQEPTYGTNFPISTMSDKNDTFQRVALLNNPFNPFDAPTFLSHNNQSNRTDDANRSTQARSKGARKLDLNNNSKNWAGDMFDTIPLDDWNEEHDFTNKNSVKQKTDGNEVSTLNSDLDVVQKYLKQTRPDGEYNDEIIATYLSCNGLLSQNNQCLQRLVCQYVDSSVKMPELEKEVASLIIYAILKNKYIDDQVKQSMRQAAQIAYQQRHGQCSQYQCLRVKPNSA